MSDSANPGADGASADADSGDGDDGGPAQVSSPDYHSENHTAAQTCGWTANGERPARRGEVLQEHLLRHRVTPLYPDDAGRPV